EIPAARVRLRPRPSIDRAVPAAAVFSRRAVHRLSGARPALWRPRAPGGIIALLGDTQSGRRLATVSCGDRPPKTRELGSVGECPRDGPGDDHLHILRRNAFGRLE